MELYLEGLDCPHCAEKIRSAAEKHSFVSEAQMNFMTKKLTVSLNENADEKGVFNDLCDMIKKTEPDVVPTLVIKNEKAADTVTFYLEELDCPNCAEKVRSAVEKNPAVAVSEMNFMAKKLTVTLKDGADKTKAIKEIKDTVVSVEPDVTPKVLGEREKKSANEVILTLQGLDCAECGEKIRLYAEKMNGVESAEFNFLSKKLKLTIAPDGKRNNIVTAITGFVNTIEPDVTVINGEAPKPARSDDDEGMPKMMIARLIVTAVIFAAGMIFRDTAYALWLFLAAYAIIGTEIVIRAVKNIFKGQPFDECFLMTLATVGAFFVGEYPEGVAVMFLYQLGEMFQGYAVRRSRKSISELMDIRPDSANIKRGDDIVKCAPEDVSIGEIMVVKPGEKVALDGIIVSGSSSVDTSALTGESVPRTAKQGDEILSGSVNLSGLIEAEVTKEFGESTVSKILELVENSAAKKARAENFITRFAKIYTPCVVAAAVLLAAIPMIINGAFSKEWLYRALSFLVVSCPCALVISVPLSFFGGIGGASKRGVLVKGGVCFEDLAKCTNIVFDKTGTLTSGTFEVTEVKPVNMTEQQLVSLAAAAESISNHPVALSIMKYYGGEISEEITAEEIAGKGVKASVNGATVLAGNTKLMADYNISGVESVSGAGTAVHIAADGKYAGYIRISDKIKPDSKKAIEQLKKAGIHTVMLTGDRKASAEAAAAELGIDEYRAELLPVDKVSAIEEIMSGGGKTAFVGDGINDAPVLMRADIGIAMGGVGSDAAIEAADVVLMTDEPSKINEAIKISKRTNGIVQQNIIFALGVKVLILILTAFGITNMWVAIFGDVGVSMIAILNAMRARKYKE